MERDLLVELHETPLPWVIKEPNLESNWCRDDKRTAKSFLSVMPRRVQEGIKLRSAPNRFQGWKGRKPMCQPSAPPSSTKINGFKSWKSWKISTGGTITRNFGFLFSGEVCFWVGTWFTRGIIFVLTHFLIPFPGPVEPNQTFPLGLHHQLLLLIIIWFPVGFLSGIFWLGGDRLAIKPSMWTTLSFYHSSWNLIPAGPQFCWRTPYGNQFIHVV